MSAGRGTPSMRAGRAGAPPAPADPAEAWRQTQRELRAWTCRQPLLDCAADEASVVEATQALASAAVAAGEDAAVVALRTELASYLAVRGLDTATAPALEALAETVAAARCELERGWERLQLALTQAYCAVERVDLRPLIEP
jgi:thioesterase domain-containing protein